MGGLFSKPKVQQAPEVKEVQVPVVNQEQVDRDTSDILKKRKGAAATVITSDDTSTTAGAVAGKQLLGQ